MNTMYRKLIIFFWVACQVVAFSLLIPTDVHADDCFQDVFNAADCMRTPGVREIASLAISMAGAVAAAASSSASWLPAAPENPAIYGTGTPDDPYRDAGAFKIGSDGKIERYPEMVGKPLNIYGSGTPDDPYRDYPDSGQSTTDVAEPDEVGNAQPATPVQPSPVHTPGARTPRTTGSQQAQTPEMPLPQSQVDHAPLPPVPATPQTPVGQAPLPPVPATPQTPGGQAPVTPQPATAQTPQTPTGKKDEKGGRGSETEDRVETEHKGPLDAAKEAAEEYGKNLEGMSEKLETVKGLLEKDPNFSPESKEKFGKYIDSVNESLGKVKDKVESVSNGIGKWTDFRDQVTDVTKELDKNIREITEAHQKALHDLKDLPPDAAQQAADLSAALDGIGRGADAVFNKIPGYKQLGGDKTFEVTKSFQEAGKGLQKAIKTLKTSESEAQGLSEGGDSVPGYTPKDPSAMAELKKLQAEAAKNAPQSTWDWWKEKLLGKTVDEKTKGFR